MGFEIDPSVFGENVFDVTNSFPEMYSITFENLDDVVREAREELSTYAIFWEFLIVSRNLSQKRTLARINKTTLRVWQLFPRKLKLTKHRG